jgi:hypothetical protein
MVLDVDLDAATGNSFEVFPNLNVIQRKPVTSGFEGWLPDKRAIIAVFAADLSWEDFYIVNFSTGEFFTPTYVANWGPVASVQPYGRDGKTGYFLTAQRSPTDCFQQYHQEIDRGAPCSQLYQVHADGSRISPSAPSGLDPAGGNTKINSHGCQMSPDGEYLVCERTGGPSTFQIIKITRIEPFSGIPGEQIQPVSIGAWWSPDSEGFIYYSEPSVGAGAVDTSKLSIYFSPAGGDKKLRIRIGCKKQDCSPNDAPNKYFVHASGKIAGTCDDEIVSGSDVGQWSNDPDGKAYYVNVVQGRESYNQIGRILLKSGTSYSFEHRTPEDVNARFPSPSPRGSSFVYVATQEEKGTKRCVSPGEQWQNEGPVQIFLFDPQKDSPVKLTHFPKGWTPANLQWSQSTSVQIEGIGPNWKGKGTFEPSECRYCGKP